MFSSEGLFTRHAYQVLQNVLKIRTFDIYRKSSKANNRSTWKLMQAPRYSSSSSFHDSCRPKAELVMDQIEILTIQNCLCDFYNLSRMSSCPLFSKKKGASFSALGPAQVWQSHSSTTRSRYQHLSSPAIYPSWSYFLAEKRLVGRLEKGTCKYFLKIA